MTVPDGGGSDERPGIAPDEILARLRSSATDWAERGRLGSLSRWMDRELDPDGVPFRLDAGAWAEGLSVLLTAAVAHPQGWPERLDALAEGWFRAFLRFSRPDNSTVFGPRRASARDGRPQLCRAWAERLSDPGLATVVDWWFPGRREGRHAPPPLPADARPDRVLAILRANWARDGDLVALDHRAARVQTRFELLGAGQSWLGPTWGDEPSAERAGRAKPTLWVSHGSADVAEWTFRVGRARVSRTAVLLRGRRLALLAEQWDGPGDPGALRLGLAEGVEAVPIPDAGSRGLLLSLRKGRSTARVLPIGLPTLAEPGGRGTLDRQGNEIVLSQAAGDGEKRVWRVLLVSWDARRNRLPVRWRSLTVSESSRPCPRDVAFGVRVAWGRDESLLIYRSLAKPALRALLGHQTRARFLVGLFTRDGEVEPFVKVEE